MLFCTLPPSGLRTRSLFPEIFQLTLLHKLPAVSSLFSPIYVWTISTLIPLDDYSGLGDGAEVSSEERFIEYLKILFTDMGVIHSMLFELDPAFVVCHDYEALGDPYQASRIANFIGPTETMASRIKETLVGSVQMRNSTGESSLPFEGATIIVDRMQSKLDAFEGTFCAQ